VSTSAGTVRLEFPARAEYLILARLAVAGVSRAVDIDEETLADLKLAVTEACGNAVRHAYATDQVGSVRVVLDVSADAIGVVVEDDGTGAGFGEELGWPADELPEGGMGIAIIRAIADDVSVTRGAGGKGTTVRFTKRLVSFAA
jgi:serine/threonine-protein kinase RsbW